jgi:hypothetical protein
MTWFWWIAGIPAALVALDRIGLWAESRGWIFWRKKRPSPGGGSSMSGPLLDIFQPSRQFIVVEQMQQEAGADESESGAPKVWVDLGQNRARIWRRGRLAQRRISP